MTDCNHKKVSYVVDGEVTILCPFCDDVDFETIGDNTGVSE